MAMNIIKYESESGMRSILVGTGQLIPRGKQHPLLISDYQWSTDRKKLLIFTNSVRVWRYNTKGDYWVRHICLMWIKIGNQILSKVPGDKSS